MPYATLADLVVLIHALFVLFVVLGGLLVLRWPTMAWLHLPAAAWGVVIELGGWICPLTNLENHFRQMAGLAAYRGTFIEKCLEPLLYPAWLTPTAQVTLGLTALIGNLVIYLLLWRRLRKS